MIEEISLTVIQNALKTISAAKNVSIDDDTLSFGYKDKDGDDTVILVTIDSDEKVTCILPLKIPEDYLVTGMICANQYNNRKDAHGTFAYAMVVNENNYIVIETNILTRGGISEDTIKYNLRNFIEHINSFEEIVFPAIEELGPDSSFLQSSGWDNFWQAAGSFFGGYTQAR